jgi:hypothetical protein
MIQFADSSDISKIPAGWQYAALYAADCAYPAGPGADRWTPGKRRWITQHGDKECSIIDYEPRTMDFQNPALLRGWLTDRLNMAHVRHSWLYSDLDNAATAAEHARGLPFQWWIATLDNVRRSPGQLSDLLLAWGVPADQAHASLIAANQWSTTGGYDGSICYVDRDW